MEHRSASQAVPQSGDCAACRPAAVPNRNGVGAHHLSRQLQALGHDARLMPAQYVKPYLRGQKNDFADAEAIAEAAKADIVIRMSVV